MTDPDVLMVGAGPAGLVLALWFAKMAVSQDGRMATDPGTTSPLLPHGQIQRPSSLFGFLQYAGRSSCHIVTPCAYRKFKSGHIGDAVRPGLGDKEWSLLV